LRISSAISLASREPITVYGWDFRNRLTTVTTYASAYNASHHIPLKTVVEQYDVFDRWIGERVYNGSVVGTAASERYFIYDGNQILLQTDGSGSVTHRYLWAPIVDMALADETSGTGSGESESVHWLLGDNLNTIRDLTDANGNLLQHTDFDTYGNVRGYTSSATNAVVLAEPVISELIGYTGRAYSKATGLQNNWHRWYDATVGQWLSEDPNPAGSFADGPNNRAYVHNGPVNGVDPTGLVDLEVEVVEKPTAIDDYGSAESKIKWKVNDKSANGWIIQHVTFKGKVRDKNGKIIGVKEIEYWEAWPVVNGKVFTAEKIGNNPKPHKEDKFAFRPGGPCTAGKVIQTGKAFFTTDIDPSKWGHLDEAGYLLSTREEPQGWTDEGKISHVLTSKWNDVTEPKIKTIVGGSP
jgi:RHS repeat-associated protein